MGAPVWKKLMLSAAVVAGVGAFVSMGTFSAFSTSVSNSSSLTTGVLSFSNSAPAQTSLDLTGLIPGDLLTRCFVIQNTGDINANVSFTITKTGSTSLAGLLKVSIEEGTGSSTDCTGFTTPTSLLGSTTTLTKTLTDVVTTAGTTPYTVTGWLPGAANKRAYRLNVSLPTSVTLADLATAQTAGLALNWSAAQQAGATR